MKILLMSIVLSCFMLCDCVYGEENSDYHFRYQIHNGEAYIVGMWGSGETLRVPAYIDNYPVRGIGNPYDDFYNGWGLTYDPPMDEEDGFTQTMVKTVILPETLRVLCTRFLADNKGVEELIISDGANFSVPDETIFPAYQDYTIKKIYVGSGMVSDDIERMFYGKALEEIEVSTNNPVYTSKDGILYSKDMKKLIICGTSNPREIIRVPEGVESIGTGFQCCDKIKEIYLPTTIKYINSYAFDKCTAKVFGLKQEDRTIGKLSGLSIVSTTKNSIKLKWKKVNNADGYVIERKPVGEYEEIDSIAFPEKYSVRIEGGNQTSYTWNGLEPKKQYTFSVYAYRILDSKEEIKSNAKKIKASTPATLSKGKIISTKRISSKNAKITWSKVKNAEGYEIYISTKKKGTYKKVATVKGGKKLSKTISKLKKGKSYYVKVRAYVTVNKKKCYGKFSNVIKIKVT